MSQIKFNRSHSAFFSTLKSKADDYFRSRNINTTGNFKLYAKTAILLFSLAVFYTLLVFFTPQSLFFSILLCILIGINFAGIGFNIMHDGAHGSYSGNKFLNRAMGYTLNLMGGNVYLWKQKHNINHHTYTNIEGADDDIDIKPFLRIHADQKKLKIHRFQHLYGFFLYGLTLIFWVYYRDFKKYFTGKIAENTRMKKMNLREHFNFWIWKFIHFGLFLVIPIFKIGLVETIVGYNIMGFVCGFLLAIVFQLAHVVEKTDFVTPSVGSVQIEKEWAVHQISTTANFATRNKTINWLLGGLNFQVEHHLFPRISHIHYPALNKIVRETCREFNVVYKEFPTMLSAIRSHLLHLKKVGVA